MKKIVTLSLSVLAFASMASAQKLLVNPVKNGTAFPMQSAQAAKGTGTLQSKLLTPASFSSTSPCLNSIGVYPDSTLGYIAGVNAYGDKEVAMRYLLTDYGLTTPTTVDTVKAFFGLKRQSGNGKVRAKVYAASSTSAPSTLLGTSADISVSNVDTTGNTTNFIFATPVALTGTSFFVSIDFSSLYATGDTVALYSTGTTCATTNQTAAWTREQNDTFYAFSDQSHNWGVKMDLAIFPHVKGSNLAVGHIAANSFAATAYPVPAAGKVTVAFAGQENGNVSLRMKDITGKVIATTQVTTVKGSNYTVPFDVSSLSSGLYFVELASGANTATLKVSVK